MNIVDLEKEIRAITDKIENDYIIEQIKKQLLITKAADPVVLNGHKF